jgi:hypothetical protein
VPIFLFARSGKIGLTSRRAPPAAVYPHARFETNRHLATNCSGEPVTGDVHQEAGNCLDQFNEEIET